MAVNARRGAATAARARGAARAMARDEARLASLRARREQEHEALLRAARRAFLRRGYAGTRVEDVLREAGISTRAFYRFHASKDELFLELFDRANAAAMRRLERSVAAHAGAAERLDAYVEATLDLAYDERLARETELFAAIPAGLVERHAAEVRACREQLVAVLRDIIAIGRRDGTFPRAVPELDAWALHGALGAALELALRGEKRPPRRDLSRALRRLTRGALGAGAVADS